MTKKAAKKTVKKSAKKPVKRSTKKERYVVVATGFRPWSIVAGILEEKNGDEVILRDARMVAYFSRDARTVFGVAAKGPGDGARVSPRVDRVCLHGVEHVIDATPAARKRIEAEPWG